jgi:hypothetical protein
MFPGFFCKMCLADFQYWLYHKVHKRTTVSVPSSELGLPTLSLKRVCPPPPGAKGLLEKSLALCLLCWLSQNREKYIKKGIKNCSGLSTYTTGIEKKSYMCHPGIEFLTSEAT